MRVPPFEMRIIFNADKRAALQGRFKHESALSYHRGLNKRNLLANRAADIWGCIHLLFDLAHLGLMIKPLSLS